MTTTLQSNLTRPLALKQGSSEVSILVPADVWVAAEQLREEFLLSSHTEDATPVAEEGAADDQAPEMALVARFLKFATDKSEQVRLQEQGQWDSSSWAQGGDWQDELLH